jgi:phosphatidate cytidylyltransferase
MRRRLITSLGLALFGLPAIIFGGIFYFSLMAIFLVGAAWEYVQLFRAVSLNRKFTSQLAVWFDRHCAHVLSTCPACFEATILAALAYHLSLTSAASRADFILPSPGDDIGWIGSYLSICKSSRRLGFMLVMPSVWLADSGAYSIGRAYGKHKMAPRLSPKKSWEGYAASIFTGMLAGIFFVYVYSAYGNLAGDITILQGAMLGLLMGMLPPLGDLGESMIKRQSGIKDSSDICPAMVDSSMC